jgi:hypothetical protein
MVGGREEIIDVKLGDDLPLLAPHREDEAPQPAAPARLHQALLRTQPGAVRNAGLRGSRARTRHRVHRRLRFHGQGMENIWARSVALSLIVIAKREKRDAAAVEFSSALGRSEALGLLRERTDQSR